MVFFAVREENTKNFLNLMLRTIEFSFGFNAGLQ